MKKILSLLSLAALTVGLLGSCSKINERIDSLEKRIDGIESTSIASVQQQIDGIKASITKLEAADVTVNGKIDELKATAEAHQTLIDALKEADKALGQKDTELEARIATLEGQVATINGQIKTLEDAEKAINDRIDELKTYVDTEIGKTKDWAEETFATLEQYQQTADDLAALSVTVTGISTTLAGVQTSIAGLDTKINGIDADFQGKITAAKTELEGKITSLKTELEGKIATAISASETSIKSWINELLEGYYTAAQVDAKIGALNTAIEASKSTAKERIDSVAKELTALKAAVDTAKANIRTEYKNAIDEAINKLDGEIRGALKDSVAAVNGRIAALDTRVTTLELKMQAVEGRVDKLEAAIGAYTELQGTITEIIKRLLAEVGDKPQSEQDTTIWKCITALQAQCGTFSTAIQTLQGLVGSKDVATQISEAIAALVTTQKLSGLADAVSALKDIVYGKGDVKSLTQQIADINEKLSTTYVTKTQLGQDIATAKADLQKQIDSLCNVIGKDGDATTATGIFKKLADLNARVAALEAVKITIESTEYTKWSDAVQAVLDKVNALGIGNISGLEAALSGLETRLGNLEAAIGAYTELQGTITEIIKKLIAEVGDKPQSEQDTTIWKCITALQAQCGTFSTAIQTLQGLVGNKDVATQISEAIASLITTQKLEGLADAVSALKDIVDINVNDVKALTLQIAEINEKLSMTNAGLDNLSKDIAAVKAELQEQIEKLKATEQNTEVLNNEIAELNAKVAALEALVQVLELKNSDLDSAIKDVLDRVNALELGDISELRKNLDEIDARLSNIEAMIQSVSIIPAYSDGSVKADEDGILTLKCIVSPAEVLVGMTLEDCLMIYADSVEVKTKAAPACMKINVEEASILDEELGVITLTADISESLPKGEGKALTVAVNIKNGISNYTTEFVPVYVAPGPDLPAGALSGKFSVSATKKVYFSKGNLYADGDKALHFEANQYNFASSWNASHVSLFTWSSTVEAAVSNSNSGDNLFCDENHKVSVNGGEAIYYALSKDEWTYLFSNHSYKWATVNGVSGYVIAPDGFSGTLADSYADDAALAANNLVFLPAAGARLGSDVDGVGDYGYYWSSAAYDGSYAYDAFFSSSNVLPGNLDFRSYGLSVRLVTEGGSPAPSVVPVTGVTLNKTELSLMEGKSETLVATVQPENATNKNVIWSSDNTGVATVGSTDGKVTAVAEGTATITAIVDGLYTATCTVTVKASLPAGALPGVFSVSDTKKILFSKGNLWYGKVGDAQTATLHFEDAQWKSTPASDGLKDHNHVSHFTWSDNVPDAVGDSYSGSNLFCDENNKQSVDGSDPIYYALSQEEWDYLFCYGHYSKIRENKCRWATVNGVGGYVIAPDDFTGTLQESYADDAALAAAGDLVFLSAAGFRDVDEFGDADKVGKVGNNGRYWSSTASAGNAAYYVYFENYHVPDASGDRDSGYSVRLITEASATPAPTPTTTGTAKRTGDIDVNWVQLWANGPKFAEYNVGASSATDIGSTMTFTDATKAGAEYVWGANWCTPSKDQMDELLKAATDAGSEKVECEYTQEGSQYGFKFTGLTVGYTDNSVFFPANGESNFQGRESYWSASADEDAKAWLMFLSHGAGGWTSKWNSFPQFLEYFVRPVLKN